MLLSMTAFGKAKVTRKEATLSLEMQSLNRKHLDIKLSLPSELRSFEPEIMRFLTSKLTRGALSIRFFAEWHEKAPFTVVPNMLLAKRYFEAGQILARELGLQESAFAEKLLLGERDLLQLEESLDMELVKEMLFALLEEGLKPFMEMKRFEGEKLFLDMQQRLLEIDAHLSKIEALAPKATERYTKKLQEKLKEILPETLHADEFLVKEIALFGERTDIAEEITRLRLHSKHFIEKATKESHPGKSLEFLLQEMLREANTIASKANEGEIAHLVIDIKSKIEQIREQVQNVE